LSDRGQKSTAEPKPRHFETLSLRSLSPVSPVDSKRAVTDEKKNKIPQKIKIASP
jgi:hypothetical protein